MHRRDLLKTALLTTGFAAINRSGLARSFIIPTRRLFFESADLSRIVSNASHPFLKEAFDDFVGIPLAEERAILEKTKVSRDFVNDLRDMTDMLNRQSLIYLVESGQPATQSIERTADRLALVQDTVEGFLGLEQWDYFTNSQDQILGFQRAPASLIAVLFAAEVLNQTSTVASDTIRSSIAEKGCEACYWSLHGMRNKAVTKDWRFDPDYFANYDVDISNWPNILDETNLKAIPISGLGLGALALKGHDERYDRWMEMALFSARKYLELFKPDGSYFEGIGYADYSLRNLFIFFEAHMRLDGAIDWPDLVNYYGFAEYAVCMQMGQRSDQSRRDIVNFSDANASFHPATAFWISNHLGDPLAQHAGLRFAEKWDFTDWLWFRPDNPASRPSDHLLNKRFDLDWIVCRSGWEDDDSVLAFRSGQPSNHEHADRNSFIFKAFGERLLTDHYGASYDWREKGWLLRQTEAHNAVLINGKGHQYHDGSEGTRPSKASAKIVRWVDRGDFVTWSSDATHAYELVHPEVGSVIRSVCFLKPDIVLIVDSVSTDAPSRVSVRFHPDNSDGHARIEMEDGGFVITRPSAALTARIESWQGLTIVQGKLDVPSADLAHLGDGVVEARNRKADYFYAEASAAMSTKTDMLTVLQASTRAEVSEISVASTRDGWAVSVGDRQLSVAVSGEIPEFLEES